MLSVSFSCCIEIQLCFQRLRRSCLWILNMYYSCKLLYYYVFYFIGKKINRVACGSAHSLAWSTNKPVNAGKIPTLIPMEYNQLQNISIIVLRNRLVLLHHFSDLFCPSIPMFDLQDKPEPEYLEENTTGLNKLRGILVSSAKETAFRKVVQATMVRDKQHGPVVELNRIQVSSICQEYFIYMSLQAGMVS